MFVQYETIFSEQADRDIAFSDIGNSSSFYLNPGIEFGDADLFLGENTFASTAFISNETTEDILQTEKVIFNTVPEETNSSHFIPVWEGNPYLPMNILIISAEIDGNSLVVGDEIGVFDLDDLGNEICVGSAIVAGSITPGSPLFITTSTDDPDTGEVDGFTPDNEIIYRLFNSVTNQEITIIGASYNSTFDENYNSLGTALVNIKGGGFPGLYVFLRDSNGDFLAGGQLEYQVGGWLTAVENSNGFFYINTDKETINLRMTYAEAPLYVTVPTSSPYSIQTVLTTFELRKRTTELGYNFGAVSYASGDTLGLTGHDGLGLFKMELLPREYTFRMKFRGGFGDITQDISVDPVVTWLMARMLVQINKSSGTRGLNGASIQYKGTSKEQFGVTGTVENGRARKDLLQGFYKFTIKYLGGSMVVDDFQIVPGDNELIIDGIATTVELLDSDNGNAPLNGGIVKNIGNTSNSFGFTGDSGPGIVTVDLLPLVYSFSMQYNTDKETKAGIDITLTPWITFYTNDLKNAVANDMNVELAAYPNPFSGNTSLAFRLENAEKVNIAVYDINGRMVEVIFDGYMEEGKHNLYWDTDQMPKGIYIVRLTSNGCANHCNVVKM